MSVIYALIAALTAIIGYNIHQSIFFSIMDFFCSAGSSGSNG